MGIPPPNANSIPPYSSTAFPVNFGPGGGGGGFNVGNGLSFSTTNSAPGGMNNANGPLPNLGPYYHHGNVPMNAPGANMSFNTNPNTSYYEARVSFVVAL